VVPLVNNDGSSRKQTNSGISAQGSGRNRQVLRLRDSEYRGICLDLWKFVCACTRSAISVSADLCSANPKIGVLLQRKIDSSLSETGATLHDRLAQIAPKALLESLRLLAAGNAPRIPQDQTLATYAPKLNREAGRINWNETAEGIERKIRAYNPWPGAFTDFKDRKLKIFSASVVDLRGTPGTILRKDNELVIATADHALSLGEVQLEGKRRMTAAEFLRGHGVPL